MHMKKKLELLLVGACALTLFTACKPDPGLGGTAQIQMTVKHHDELIPGAQIYILYGSKLSPGTSPSAYDDFITAGVDAKATFGELEKGDYYLFSRGYDSSIQDSVFGGIPISIKKKGEVVVTDVPVTE